MYKLSFVSLVFLYFNGTSLTLYLTIMLAITIRHTLVPYSSSQVFGVSISSVDVRGLRWSSLMRFESSHWSLHCIESSSGKTFVREFP